jgi:hypothetical protein
MDDMLYSYESMVCGVGWGRGSDETTARRRFTFKRIPTRVLLLFVETKNRLLAVARRPDPLCSPWICYTTGYSEKAVRRGDLLPADRDDSFGVFFLT